jgi:hypothetical protein
MGTRSLTIVMEDNQEVCRIYRQMDGYPDGHGLELAKLCNVKIVNGIGADKNVANGMGCLAAQIIAGLKDGPGHIYLEPTGGEIGDWIEYVYIVRGKEGSKPTIECSTQTGTWPFNTQTENACVWPPTAADKITKKFCANAT